MSKKFCALPSLSATYALGPCPGIWLHIGTINKSCQNAAAMVMDKGSNTYLMRNALFFAMVWWRLNLILLRHVAMLLALTPLR